MFSTTKYTFSDPILFRILEFIHSFLFCRGKYDEFERITAALLSLSFFNELIQRMDLTILEVLRFTNTVAHQKANFKLHLIVFDEYDSCICQQ